jgi:hypothetical protein
MEALSGYRELLEQVDAHPEWNVFESAAGQARRGLADPLAAEPLAVSHYVLRLPE